MTSSTNLIFRLYELSNLRRSNMIKLLNKLNLSDIFINCFRFKFKDFEFIYDMINYSINNDWLYKRVNFFFKVLNKLDPSFV